MPQTLKRQALAIAISASVLMLISALTCPLSAHTTREMWALVLTWLASGAALGAVVILRRSLLASSRHAAQAPRQRSEPVATEAPADLAGVMFEPCPELAAWRDSDRPPPR